MKSLFIAAASLALLAPGPASAQPTLPLAAAQGQVTQMDHISIEALGAGPPVVLIPGLGSPREVFRPFVAELARHHRVLMVQVNGFGGSAPAANAQGNILPGVVADLSRYLSQNRLGSADIVGQSMGGLLGLMMARDHADQVRGVLVVDALPFIGTLFSPNATVETVRPGAEQMRAMLASGAAQRGPASAEDPGVQTMSNTPAGRLLASQSNRQANSGVFAQAMYEDATTDVGPDLARIARVPIRVLYAARADMAERAGALFAGAYAPAPSIRVTAVPDSLHFIMLDQPERFRAALADFLAR